MTTQAQDTHPQDPIDRLTLRIEEMRGDSVVRGPARVLHNLFLEFFLAMIRLLASFAEMRRNGTLPVIAPVVATEQPRAWPADLRPRESGWLEYQYAEGAFEQPETNERVEALQARTPCAMPLPR